MSEIPANSHPGGPVPELEPQHGQPVGPGRRIGVGRMGTGKAQALHEVAQIVNKRRAAYPAC